MERVSKQEIYEILHDQWNTITIEFIEELLTRTGKIDEV